MPLRYSQQPAESSQSRDSAFPGHDRTHPVARRELETFGQGVSGVKDQRPVGGLLPRTGLSTTVAQWSRRQGEFDKRAAFTLLEARPSALIRCFTVPCVSQNRLVW